MGRGEACCVGPCCCAGSQVDNEEEYDPSHNGPIKDRSCTDIICLLLFIVFLLGWGVVSVYAFVNGNPQQLIYPSNSRGEICGTADHSEKPFLLFFDLTVCIGLSATIGGCATPQVCVRECPSGYWSYITGKTKELQSFCTDLSPGEFEGTDVNTLIRLRKCPAYLLDSTHILGRCVPNFGILKLNSSEETLIQQLKKDDNTAVDTGNLTQGIKFLMSAINLGGLGDKLLTDLSFYWWILLLSLLASMLLSFFWIALLRYAAGPMVWLSIILGVTILMTASALFWYRYTLLLEAGTDADKDAIFLPPGVSAFSSFYFSPTFWIVAAIILTIITVFIILILIFLRSRIVIAIELIEAASQAIGSNMTTLFFPGGPFILEVLCIIWFCLIASFLASSGEAQFKVVDTCKEMNCLNPETNQAYYKNQVCEPTSFNCSTCPQAKCVFHKFGPGLLGSVLQVYNLFALFWVLFFTQALGEMILAGVFAGWFWTMDKVNDLPLAPIFSSAHRTFRYHLGTIAFGSLILTVVRMIRVFLEFIEQRLKQYGPDNVAVKAVLCMCKCCFYCLENCLRFLNRNAYIMTAVYGYNFCSGARRSFMLLARNLARVSVLDKVTDFILLIGKIIVLSLVLLFALALYKAGAIDAERQLNFQIVPVLLIILTTYAVSSSFFSVYSMAVDTIFLCFLEDIEKHDGSEENPYFMHQDLRRVLGYMNKIKQVEESKQE